MITFKQLLRAAISIDFVAVVAMLGLFFFPITWPFAMPYVFWLKQLIEYILYGIFYFGNVFFLYPKLANKKYGLLYFGILCLCIYIIPTILNWVRNITHLNETLGEIYSSAGHPFRPNDKLDTTVVVVISLVFLTLSYISVVSKKMQENRLAYDALERERISAELSFLKAQINPHFFFNTLHTIYALIDTDQPAAKNSIYSLSHMMRYVLYDTRNEQTLLKKEIGFIEDYIALMKVRTSENVQIIFDKSAGLADLAIAPMLFLPFFENAFKHGISAVQPSYIFIGISTNASGIMFEVRNSLFEKLGKQLDEEQGIGVANTRRRLDLLYPGKYSLLIDRDLVAKEHTVTLTIDK